MRTSAASYFVIKTRSVDCARFGGDWGCINARLESTTFFYPKCSKLYSIWTHFPYSSDIVTSDFGLSDIFGTVKVLPKFLVLKSVIDPFRCVSQ